MLVFRVSNGTCTFSFHRWKCSIIFSQVTCRRDSQVNIMNMYQKERRKFSGYSEDRGSFKEQCREVLLSKEGWAFPTDIFQASFENEMASCIGKHLSHLRFLKKLVNCKMNLHFSETSPRNKEGCCHNELYNSCSVLNTDHLTVCGRDYKCSPISWLPLLPTFLEILHCEVHAKLERIMWVALATEIEAKVMISVSSRLRHMRTSLTLACFFIYLAANMENLSWDGEHARVGSLELYFNWQQGGPANLIHFMCSANASCIKPFMFQIKRILSHWITATSSAIVC